MGFPLERLFNPRPFNDDEQAHWAAWTCGEEDDEQDLGAELLEDEPGLVGDVGRDPFGGLVND